ncbi:lamin tail domain-containing protein [Halomicrococcus sp. SG-WS-1]|uniref:lamin tail domain-containing protein n=1 Tax=Halomicrococcus sp. SG-WS-1 TaxID=3439057 RepID=UPI003F79F535
MWAESTASNEDADGNGDATRYSDSTAIPVVAVDGDVVGFGATLVSNDANFRSGNEEFVLNVWDTHLGGSGTVLYDEGHDQYHSLADFSNMANYAEENGYTVQATSTLASDLSSADAAWITGPATAFTSSEKQSLAGFVADGGVLFCHDRADYSNHDETANFNDIASDLSLAFRFNDDQVTDDTNNGGAYYKPTTDQYNTAFEYFTDRPGMEIDPDVTHDVAVIDVNDGDTVDVRFDSGREETIRILGIDTPEKAAYQRYEREEEWEGIESLDYLATWGANASEYASQELSSTRIDLSFDDGEAGIFDAYDRLLGYIHYDASGDGVRNTFYNYEMVRKGYARLYSSSFTNHESFYDAEADAQANARRVWTDSDPADSSEYRNRDADDLFFPQATTVKTTDGAVPDSDVAVVAESSATQSVTGGYDYGSSDLPLVGVDETAGVAVVGGLLIDETYEKEEGFAVDTASYENFVVLTNLIDYLSHRDGQVLVDGGHNQFGDDFALSSEDAAYYQRHLEGFDIAFEQVNELTTANLSRGRVLVVTTPPQSFTSTELDAVQGFVDDGGAVVLMGASNAPDSAVTNLNEIASSLGTHLRLNDDAVTDSTNNVNADSSLPTTTVFDTSYPIFSAYPSVGGAGALSIAEIHEDAAGTDADNLNDEYVVFENTGTGDLDLTGWSVEDAVGHTYEFPSGYTLTPGASVTLHTGSGTDTDSDLYWNYGSSVWNNDSDTCSVYDDTGSLVTEQSYPSSSGSGAIDVQSVHADAAGSDSSNLNDEYVVFENTGSATLDCTGYTVEDAAGHTYAFPDGFSLDAGATVTLHTGSGTDTASDLYWGSGSPIWNNSGDTVYVFDDAGTRVETYSY